MEHIYVSGPSITQKEIDYVTDAVTNAWYGNHSMYHVRFEKAFADYLGVKFAVSLPSCTSGIHLALAALGIGPGDEVIVPEITWIASSAPVTYVGATTVFADVEEDTWCLSAESFAANITPNTKAVIPVDIYGSLPDYDAIREIAAKHNIAIIEDAAEAIGCEYKGKRAGSLGNVSVFSFHGSKTLTTGEGGMLLTDDETLYNRVMVLRDHGREPGNKAFANTEVAYKYKMSSMQAALGLAQVERIDELVARKREIFAWYQEYLADMDDIAMNVEPEGTLNTFWMVSIILDPKYGLDKDTLQGLMQERDIDTRPFFRPLSSLAAYANQPQAKAAQQRNPISYKVSPYGLNLPSGLDMAEKKVKHVCETLKAILDR